MSKKFPPGGIVIDWDKAMNHEEGDEILILNSRVMNNQKEKQEPIPMEKAREMINGALDKIKTEKEKGILKPVSKEAGLKKKLNIETKE